MANLDSPQWKRAQQTSLWKRTLGSDDEDVKPLRESFLDARENAAFLLDKIRPDFPNLTIHDITHVDSLWTVADAIIGDNYPINPLEGYVLGIAFLIHDAALSYDAVGGKDKLREENVWKDAFAEGPGDKDEEAFMKECDFTAIRAIHAREAKEILGRTFSSEDLPSFHIVKKASYRQSLGESIGKIAASHHWSIDEVESKLDIQITPSVEVSGPGDWDINEQKLACILRCADAGHIDDGRAPYYIFRSLNINGVSLEHWKSQSRLGVVRPYRKDESKLLITSTSSFKKEDFAAWNVAYEAVKLFDEEIKKSNNLLKSIDDKLVFPRTGVMGASSKEELAEYIKTEGWQPCSLGVHTSNIKYLIETLGGSKLYGEDHMLLVALRELIQNARDAIHARQKLDDSFDNGKITIRIKKEGEERFIEVEDNGIGMSMDCIKHNLLDFGNSYWNSPLSKYENPGLRSSGFTSVGKFGIGFYSVFMVAKSVEVRTKRYRKSVDEAKKIEFPKGLTLSPIISNDTMGASVSTIVRFALKDDVELSFSSYIDDTIKISIQKVFIEKALHILVAALDADVFFEYLGKPQKIHSNILSPDFDKAEWFGGLFLRYSPVNIDYIASKMEVLKDENGEQTGMLLPPEYRSEIVFPDSIRYRYYDRYLPGIQTIGGLASLLDITDSFDKAFVGYLNGKENSISRNHMNLDKPLMNCLSAWTKKKYLENYDKILNNEDVADHYRELVHFCKLENALVNENIKRLYKNKGSVIEVESIRGLMDIHRHLYVGIDYEDGFNRRQGSFAGCLVLEDYKFDMNVMEAILDFTKSGKTLDDLSYHLPYDHSQYLGHVSQYLQDIFSHKDHYSSYHRGRSCKEELEVLLRINNVQASSYNMILLKYRQYFFAHPFRIGNKEVLGVWVNLMLEKVSGKMIDWRKVDRTRLNEEIKALDELRTYLEPFLSSTYLDEMINN